MGKNQSKTKAARMIEYSGVILLIGLMLMILTLRGFPTSGAHPLSPLPTPNPTAIFEATRLAAWQWSLTKEAGSGGALPGPIALTPPWLRPTPPLPTAFPTLLASTPVGAGYIAPIVPPFSSMEFSLRNAWYKLIDGGKMRVEVYAGSVPGPGGEYTDQGEIIVVIRQITVEGGKSDIKVIHISRHLTPTKSGPVTIIDAVGERLILQSTTGVTFYFDVPSRQFVPSLTWISPIATPVPTTLSPP